MNTYVSFFLCMQTMRLKGWAKTNQPTKKNTIDRLSCGVISIFFPMALVATLNIIIIVAVCLSCHHCRMYT